MQIRSALILALIGILAAQAMAADQYANLVRASLLADADAAVPGGPLTLGVLLKIKPEWHTYWINPGETGEATQIKMTGPAGFEFGPIQWPIPTKINMDGAVTYGYENEVLLMVPVKISKEFKPGGEASISAEVRWLSCNNTCIPGEAKLSIVIPINTNSQPANVELFKTWRRQLPDFANDGADLDAIFKLEQSVGADGNPAAELTIHWKHPPKNADWLPVATEAVAIGKISIKTEGAVTHVTYRCRIYKPVPEGKIDSLVVYENGNGERRGVMAPVKVPKPK